MKRLAGNVVDGALAVLGLAGLLLFAWVLPRHHPDAAADFSLERDAAIQRARSFLAESGVEARRHEATVQPRRHDDLIEQIQQTRGRAEAVRFLQGEGKRLPAYYWSVRFTQPAPPDSNSVSVSVGTGNQGSSEEHYSVYLTTDGRPWSLELPEKNRTLVNREAFREVYEASPDSLSEALLYFAGMDSVSRPLDQSERPRENAGNIELPLGPRHAVALARHHLGHTAWPSAGRFRVDSTWQEGRRAATVRFASTIGEQAVRADVTVAAGGALRAMDVAFKPGRRVEEMRWQQLAKIVRLFVVLLLLGVLGIVFFRRLMNRLIDVRTALVDAGIASVLFLIYFGTLTLTKINVQAEASSPSYEWIALVAAGGAAALVVGMPFFMVSAVAESLTRETWPAKEKTLGLLRRGAVRNAPVGGALVRGVALAGVLLGVAASTLLLFPRAAFRLNDQLSWQLAPLALPGQLARSGLLAYFGVLAVLAGAGTLLQRWTNGRAALVILGVVLVGAPLLDQFATLRPVSYQWTITAAVSLATGAAFWRYDLLTCFTGFFLTLLAWTLSTSWLVGGATQISVLGGAGVALGVAALGAWGLASGRSAQDTTEYVPDYVKKLTEEQRMQRELEIAREVHTSFLPRRMPRVEGLDLAAFCLAANEVGGDYYDFVETEPGQLAILVGDVSGKGIQAAFYMTLAKGVLQTLSREERSPAAVLRRLNALFRQNAPRGTFISLICGFLDVETGTLTFARAGHNPVVHVREDEAELIRPHGLAIGLAADATFDVEEVTLSLERGDVLAFYTDGITEAMNPTHEQYGTKRLARCLSRVNGGPARAVLQAVADDVDHFIEPAERRDDMTMVVVKYEGAPPPRHDTAPSHVVDAQSVKS